MSLRMERINRELRKQIMSIIQKEIDDPDMDFLSITRVDTTKDLQESRVYFSLLDENKYDKAKQILDDMRGFIRTNLGKKIRLKIYNKFVTCNKDVYKICLCSIKKYNGYHTLKNLYL